MKRSLCLLCLVFSVIFALCACGNASPFDVAKKALDSSEMSLSVYSESEIKAFEARFTKMSLDGGFNKVYHYKSKTEYAYLIEFENENDAIKFYDIVKSSRYDSAMLGAVVVYGKADCIEKINFE